jgi:L-lysine 6-transaminase
MVRSRRLLEIIEADDLFDLAAKRGVWFLHELHGLEERHPHLVTNVRGRGLMCAIDLPDAASRDYAVAALRDEHVIALSCGGRSIRFRPALSVTEDELAVGVAALDRVLHRLAATIANEGQ